MIRTYDLARISSLLDQVRADLGDEQFAAMKLLELEKVARAYDPHHELPGKTLLRAQIHAYRAARRPETEPTKAPVQRA